MILCDSEIRTALANGDISIEPRPDDRRISTTAVDLLLGDREFRRWSVPTGPGIVFQIDTSERDWLLNCAKFLTEVPRESDGSVILAPGDFILALTHEVVKLPTRSRIAARVEGKSSLARLGVGVHVTAPTIHSGFDGFIALEIKNHGNVAVRLRPGTAICQLIFEMVFGTPTGVMRGTFQNQTSVAGKAESV